MVFTVSELAEQGRVSADAVRYYGRLGLLPETGRSGGGHRYYDEEALERLRFIKGAQWLDLTLDEIRELLELWDRGACPCGPASAVLHKRIVAIDEHVVRLQKMRRVLTRMLGGGPEAGDGAGADSSATGEETVNGVVGDELGDGAGGGCGCCQPPTREEEILELRSRLAAVQRRLGRVGEQDPDGRGTGGSA